MTDTFCICMYKSMIQSEISTFWTVVEFLFSLVIIICGVTVNYRFKKKLQEEKRRTPIGRRGNVIEPVMSWFCTIQIIYWPYVLLFLWVSLNELIISADDLPVWLCYILMYTMKFGRMCIAYNSLFVVLIRFAYIVHDTKANQWNFESTGKRFQVGSIAIPFALEVVGLFTSSYPKSQFLLFSNERYLDCVEFYDGTNSTTDIEWVQPITTTWTIQYLPESFVYTVHLISITITMLVWSNITEAFFYFKIFQRLRR